jgi:hypothetical protein
MSDGIITALLAFGGTCLVTFSGIKLIAYRLEQLEKKVDKHNNVIERMTIAEKDIASGKDDIKEIRNDIKDIKAELNKE